MDTLLQEFRDHAKQDDQRLGAVGEDIKDIKNNHLAHIEPDIATIKTTLAALDAHIGWVKWIGMAIVGALIANFFHK